MKKLLTLALFTALALSSVTIADACCGDPPPPECYPELGNPCDPPMPDPPDGCQIWPGSPACQ
jgi:hypothetical protein